MSGGHEKGRKEPQGGRCPDLLDPNDECCHDVTLRRLPSASVHSLGAYVVSLRHAPKRQNKVSPSPGADPRICVMAGGGLLGLSAVRHAHGVLDGPTQACYVRRYETHKAGHAVRYHIFTGASIFRVPEGC